jgi:hypothetical protein
LAFAISLTRNDASAFFVRVKTRRAKTRTSIPSLSPRALHADAGRQGWRFKRLDFLSEASAGSEADVSRCGAKLLLRCDEQNVLHRGAENGSVVGNGDLSERKTAV